MDATTNLRLPYIMAAQAQKHVTHNEAIRALDAILHLSVRDRNLTAPPGFPAEGDRYIVAAPAAAAWSGHEHEIAAYQDGAWMFYAPCAGWIAWLIDENAAVVWDGSAWVAFGSGGGTGSTPAMLGINASPDATNRLSLSSPASLFSHEGSGHQIKINKAAAGDTASTLYQTGFEGRAEMGLTGDDDFHFKVSPDGATWNEAIVIARNTGAVTFPNTPGGGGGAGREMLTSPRTYYVNAATGSDASSGLSGGAAFATIQKAIDTVSSLDLGIHDVTIQVAAGTYPAANTLKPLVGAGRCFIVGDEATPANVLIDTAESSFTADSIFSIYHLRGMKLQSATWSAINATGPGKVFIRNIEFGECLHAHWNCQLGAVMEADGDYSISGGARSHWISSAATLQAVSRTITLTGSPAFGTVGSQGFAAALRGGAIIAALNTFPGAALGRRYYAATNGIVDTQGAGIDGFPGSIAGATATGGEYI